MPPLGPITRRDLIRYLKQPGFEGPYAGGRPQFMVKGDPTLHSPNPHQADIGRELLARILRQAGISRQEWQELS